MTVKVCTKESNASVTDISLLIETSDRYMDWDDQTLSNSITEETGIPADVSMGIAKSVRERVQELADKMGWSYVSTTLIREIVEQELMSKGRRYKNRAKKYRTLGLSESEITQIVERDGAADNGNLGHNPDAVLFVSAETVMKQYALKHVFPEDVVEAHLSGDFSLHDLGAPFKIYAFSKETKTNVMIKGIEEEITFESLWNKFYEIPVDKIGDQEIKSIEDGILKVIDRGQWVSVLRLIKHNETKEMRDFDLSDGSKTSVTADHGCLIKRGNSLLIVRADEVLGTDFYIKAVN